MTFGDWLREQLSATGVSRRELARRLAGQHPQGSSEDAFDAAFRTVKRVLSGSTRNPTRQTRNSICDALGVPREEAPRDDDSDEPITREMVVEWLRDAERDLRRFKRALLGDGMFA